MGINLGDVFPNFEVDTTEGKIRLHEWMGDSWCILFSHPNDFTPVCTTELGRVAELMPKFQERNVKVIALSCNSVESHNEWIKDIQCYSNCSGDKFPYPIISDPNRTLAVSLGMLDPEEKDSTGMPLTCRAVFIIDSNKKLKLSILYPATTGRNFNEILRVIDSLLLTDKKKVATPADWKDTSNILSVLNIVTVTKMPLQNNGKTHLENHTSFMQGDDCMIIPTIPQADVPKLFPKGHKIIPVPSKKEYLRITPQP